jgi:hypothetical protein
MMHEPIHPGEILREDFMQPFSLTAHRLAMELAVSAPRVNDLIREKRGHDRRHGAAASALLRHHPGLLDEPAIQI